MAGRAARLLVLLREDRVDVAVRPLADFRAERFLLPEELRAFLTSAVPTAAVTAVPTAAATMPAVRDFVIARRVFVTGLELEREEEDFVCFMGVWLCPTW